MFSLATGDAAIVTLVLDRSELFGFDVLVTIYFTERFEQGGDQVFERLIGVGRVSNVQQNGLVQVEVLVEVAGHAEIWQRVRNREQSAIAQVVVKPSVPYNAVGLELRLP